jgi:hypothetical protein
LSYRDAQRLYAGQIRCLHRAVAEVLGAVDRTVGRNGAIVIVHGDHGWRMSPELPRGSTADRERLRINTRYSTLLAIRRPGFPAVLHRRAVPIQDFLWTLIRNDFKEDVRATWEHFIYLRPDGPDIRPSPAPVRLVLDEEEMLWARPRRGDGSRTGYSGSAGVDFLAPY